MYQDPEFAKVAGSPAQPAGSSRSARAVALWEGGDFDACLRTLEECPIAEHTSESVLIRARALLRLNRVIEAEEWLALTAGTHASSDALATHAMLAGSAAARLRKPAAAQQFFERAESANPHVSILAELSYCRALNEWQAGRFDSVHSMLARALHPSHDIIYARALSLVGWTSMAQGRYAEGATQFEVALSALKQCRHKDDHLYATLLHALAIGVAELAAGDVRAVEADVDAFGWTSSEVLEQFQTLRHLGIAYARRGQASSGLRLFLRAADIAPRTPWSVLAYAECAETARCAGEKHGAAAFLAAAGAAAEHIDWDLVEGESRFALLALAEALARAGESARAQKFQSMFGADPRLGELSALRNDPRAALYERHVAAVVAGAQGDLRGALASLADIQVGWAKIGYYWRSLEAKHDAALFMGKSEAPARTRPRTPADRPVELTRDQRQLLRLVMQGYARKEIAELLHFSEHTIRNYLSVLYELFGVPGRSALIIRCMNDERILEMLAH